MTHSKIQQHHCTWQEYLKLQGFSNSYFNGYIPKTNKMLLGSEVDAILTENKTSDDRIANEIANTISKRWGTILSRLQAQTCYTGIIEAHGMKLPVKGRLDYDLPKVLILDLKVTSATNIRALIDHMDYHTPIWNYARLSQSPQAYILPYSTVKKKCLDLYPIDVSGHSHVWENRVLEYGSL